VYAVDDTPQCYGLAGNRPPKPIGFLKVGRIIGKERAYFLWSLNTNFECASKPSHCRSPSQPYIIPGDLVAVVGSVLGFVCAEYLKYGPQGSRTLGWLPAKQVSIDPPDTPIRSLHEWIGVWRHNHTTINISLEGKSLRAEGHAIWQGAVSPAPHFGNFDYTATPVRNTVTLAREDALNDCKLILLALKDRLAVIDNSRCGGYNVTFSGFYTHDQ
jgi:hypothetical protein